MIYELKSIEYWKEQYIYILYIKRTDLDISLALTIDPALALFTPIPIIDDIIEFSVKSERFDPDLTSPSSSTQRTSTQRTSTQKQLLQKAKSVVEGHY